MNLKKFLGLALSCTLFSVALVSCGPKPAESSVTSDTTQESKTESESSTEQTVYYTVLFKNGEEVLQTSQVEKGGYASYTGETPTKDATAEYSYVFRAWDKDPATTVINADTTFLAEFDATKRSYTARFMNGEVEFATQTVEYGAYATVPAGTPEKAQTAEHTYTFNRWEPDVATTAIVGDTTFTAIFDESARLYTVTFMNGEDLFATAQVAYGGTATAPEATPTKASTEQHDYVFDKWSPDLATTVIVEDTTFTATFKEEVRKYTVTFVYGEQNIQQKVAYGSMPDMSFLDSFDTDETHYVFEFDKEIAAVTGDVTYTVTNVTAYAKKVLLDDFEAYNADNLLSATYETHKYGTTDWTTTNAYFKYENSELPIDGGNVSGRFHIWSNGSAFRVSRDITVPAQTYLNNVHIEVKSVANSALTIRFVAQQNMAYFDYKINAMPSENWLSIDAPLAAFKANGSATTLEEFAISKNTDFRTLGSFLAKLQIIYKYSDNAGGQQRDVFIDNVSLGYKAQPALNIAPVDFLEGDQYILAKGDSKISLKVKEDNKVAIGIGGQEIEGLYQVGYDSANNKVGVAFMVNNEMMQAVLTDSQLIVANVEGALANYVAAGDTFGKVSMMFDFEKYTATGTAYDGNNSIDKRSGVRGDFFIDYYSNSSNNQSEVGGNNWSRPTSTDYMTLKTTGGYNNSKAVTLKASGSTMRYCSWSVYSEDHNKGVRANTFSFMVKGGSVAKSVKVKAYYHSFDYTKSTAVRPATQGDYCVSGPDEGFSIKPNGEWQVITLDLTSKANKIFYGFSITFPGSSGTEYLYVDNICFYYTSPY